MNLGPDFGVWNLTFLPKINIVAGSEKGHSLAATERVHFSVTSSWELHALEGSLINMILLAVLFLCFISSYSASVKGKFVLPSDKL